MRLTRMEREVQGIEISIRCATGNFTLHSIKTTKKKKKNTCMRNGPTLKPATVMGTTWHSMPFSADNSSTSTGF